MDLSRVGQMDADLETITLKQKMKKLLCMIFAGVLLASCGDKEVAPKEERSEADKTSAREWAELRLILEEDVIVTNDQIRHVRQKMIAEGKPGKALLLKHDLEQKEKFLSETRQRLKSIHNDLLRAGVIENVFSDIEPVNSDGVSYASALDDYVEALQVAARNDDPGNLDEGWKERQERYRQLREMDLDEVLDEYGGQ